MILKKYLIKPLNFFNNGENAELDTGQCLIQRSHLNFITMRLTSYILIFSILFFNFFGCSQTLVYTSHVGVYQEGMIAYYDEKKQKAILNFERINKDFSNSKYVPLSNLALADSHLDIGSISALNQSSVYYNYYIQQEGGYYVPYALNRLMIVALRKNEKRFFKDKLQSDKSASFLNDVVDDYYRLLLLHNNSIYLNEAVEFYRIVHNLLAEHEYRVAEWYCAKNLYFSAILRYEYLLKNFPYFPQKEEAIAKLILIYKIFNLNEKVEDLKNI